MEEYEMKMENRDLRNSLIMRGASTSSSAKSQGSPAEAQPHVSTRPRGSMTRHGMLSWNLDFLE